ncbi:actin binding protein 1 [Lycorma delicatula]|uniref:actin binding protein 1 n=1 Tax=Lycorma delicatula TaxID=130591 RepID=UPI003F510A4C
MAVNLTKNKESILSAWKDVVDDKSKTDWALFGYEGLTNDLKVVSKGDGGIEEMREDLNSGKIMYAFCKVLDPKTSLHKFVLINWQGEGAPNLRKGTCANHIRDVANVLKGAHITVNARTEEEVEVELIIEKLVKSTGSAYSFKEKTEIVKDSGPVGTTYKRVIPKQEINTTERDKFWQKEEEEEKRRIEEENRKKLEERLRIEEELRKREIEEAALREAKIKERSASITIQREAERNERRERIEDRTGDEDDDREQQERERRTRSDILRQQRNQEAQELISKRTIDARAVFEQNTSAGQILQRRASYNIPSTPVTTSHKDNVKVTSPVFDKVSWPPANNTESVKQPTYQRSNSEQIVTSEKIPEPQIQLQTQPQSQPQSQTQPQSQSQSQPQLQLEPQPQSQPEIEQEASTIKEQTAHDNSSVELAEPYVDPIYSNGGMLLEDDEDLGLRAQALYDYQAADDTEISFDPGDIITHIDQIDAGWWQGMGPDGSFGLFPANYVQLLD